MKSPLIPFALLLVALVGHLAFAEEEGGPAMAASEIVASCADCHDIDTPAYRDNPHAVLNRDPALAMHLGVNSSCTACHGDPAAHIESGGEEGTIFTFGENRPAMAQTEACLSCHADAHPRFAQSSHAKSGLTCTSCHSIHSSGGDANLLATTTNLIPGGPEGSVSATCGECHGDVLAQFQFNERHRLEEGILDCSSCHDPHAPQSRLMLGGFKQEQCVQCHADKGGPFVFEHGSQRVEGCIACHDPHGSPNRHLLSFQSVADLCYSCHVVLPGFHTRFENTTQCTNCHSTIHGSNFHPAFLK
jgi:DmsE family decaheme c-type cytochrome